MGPLREELGGAVGKNDSLTHQTSWPFLLGGVAGQTPAAPGITTRCHSQLTLEMKAAKKEKGWMGKRKTPFQGMSELGKGLRLLGWLLIFFRKVIGKGSFVCFQNSPSHADGKSQLHRFFVGTCCTQALRILLNIYYVPGAMHIALGHSIITTILYSNY